MDHLDSYVICIAADVPGATSTTGGTNTLYSGAIKSRGCRIHCTAAIARWAKARGQKPRASG